MQYAGIDIGSRTVELVLVDETGTILESFQEDTGFDPIAVAKTLTNKAEFDHIMATGYGRNLFEIAFEAPTVTEIKAHARGALAYFPDARVILDIGGQDSKAIALLKSGKVQKFEMNDRCAAGTGKFLEVMAKALGYEIDNFGDHALQAQDKVQVSSMCTVFAESEVTSLIAKGYDRSEIARGLHTSVVRRAIAMINRICPTGDIVFTGGVAKNPCISGVLEQETGRTILRPHDPQIVGALGAALLAKEKNQ